MIQKRIAVMPGDGIGQELIPLAVQLLLEVGSRRLLNSSNPEDDTYNFILEERAVGGAAIDLCGDPLMPGTIDWLKTFDACLFGSVGTEEHDANPPSKQPLAALLTIRRELGLWLNIRPIRSIPGFNPYLRCEEPIDMIIVRELTGGIYFGQHNRTKEVGEDVMSYSVHDVERIARFAFDMARSRSSQLCSVDKANVLSSSELWRDVVTRIHREEFPDVSLEHLLVDNAAAQLIRRPHSFDVILSTNCFGDILSDEAAMLTGSIGSIGSASLNSSFGLYEPIGGSAPDIAGQGIANPLGMLLCVAMMFRFSFNDHERAEIIEKAAFDALTAGYRTLDLCPNAEEGITAINTHQFFNEILKRVQKYLK